MLSYIFSELYARGQLPEESYIDELDLPLRATRDRGSNLMTPNPSARFFQLWAEIKAVRTTTATPKPVLNPLPIPIGDDIVTEEEARPASTTSTGGATLVSVVTHMSRRGGGTIVASPSGSQASRGRQPTMPARQSAPLEIGLALFVRLISHQPAVLFSQNKSATNNHPVVLFSQNKPAPAISHQPNEHAEDWVCHRIHPVAISHEQVNL
jgi:hypothetical protein